MKANADFHAKIGMSPRILKETNMEKNDNTKMFEPKVSKLMEMSEDIVKYLQENFNPHTTVVIEWDGIRIEETLATMPKECAVD